jgi:hypothetical protein
VLSPDSSELQELKFNDASAIGSRILTAKRQSRRKLGPRPLVEQLQRIDIADLCRWRVFPEQLIATRRIGGIAIPISIPGKLVISLENIEANQHSGYTQIIPLRWIRTGFGGNGRPRPLMFCNCGRSVTKLYFIFGFLACRRCHGAIHASQVCDKYRLALKAQRINTFLKHQPKLFKHTRQRLKARLSTTPPQELNSTRLSCCPPPITTLRPRHFGARANAARLRTVSHYRPLDRLAAAAAGVCARLGSASVVIAESPSLAMRCSEPCPTVISYHRSMPEIAMA